MAGQARQDTDAIKRLFVQPEASLHFLSGSTNIDNLYGLRVIQSCQNICLFQELSRKLQEHFVTVGKNLPQWHPREPIRL